MNKLSLKREITASSILMVSAGGMIGCGWLFSPLYAAQLSGPASLIAWALASAFMFFIALTLCELGTMFPVSGGLSNYPKITHGPLIGFILSWTSWLSYVVMTPIEVQAILQYASIFIPSLSTSNNGYIELTRIGYIAALFIMIILVAINATGIRFLSESNKFISIWKFAIPSLAIIFLLSSSQGLNNLSAAGGFMPNGWHGVFASLSLGGVAFAFTGFQNGLILAGEVKNPQRNIPISILGAVLLGFIFYSFLQIAFILALPQNSLEQGWGQIKFNGDAGPLVGLLGILGFAFMAKLLLVDASISPLGTAVVYTAATSRILYGMSIANYLPRWIARLNKARIPYVTLIINLLFGLLAFFPFPSWQKMVGFLSSTSILSYAIGPICLLALRHQQPNKERPFLLPFHRIISLIAFYACNLMLYWSGWEIFWKLYLAIIIGIIIYTISYFTKKNKFKSLKKENIELKSSLWFFVYLTTMLAISYYGSYGGGLKLLLMPFDFIILFITSVIYLWMSKIFCISPEKSEKFSKEIYSK
jgi:amino acid transporter